MAQPPSVLAPIPMDDRLFSLALKLKEAGLDWQPTIGCFVWDPQGFIAAPSPFAKRVYFILSLKRFLGIFGDLDTMRRHLVWLPTWYQTRQLLDQLPAGGRQMPSDNRSAHPAATPEEEMIHLYQRLLQRLTDTGPRAAPCREAASRPNGGQESTWVQSVIASDLGSLRRLPPAVQRRVEAVYGEVAKAYLGWRRIQEGQAEDWLPREAALDAHLLSELGHFYSDYQRPIQRLTRIRKAVQSLNALERSDAEEDYDRLIATILEIDSQHPSPQEILTQLTAPDRTDPVT